MRSSLKLMLGLAAVVLAAVASLFVYHRVMAWQGRTPEGYQLLTIVPNVAGFEPNTMPAGPVLENQSTGDLAVNFGYKVGNVPYSYSLVLAFPSKSQQGHATVTARHSAKSASVQSDAVRRWDEPRKAYAVALQDHFELEPKVPSLCIKAVIGPSDKNYDLKDGSVCVAQRDASGGCHPETLACGLIRQ